MGLFENHELRQLTQYEGDNVNSSIAIKEIEFVIQTPKKETSGPR